MAICVQSEVDRERLDLRFQRHAPGAFGEIIQAAVLWNRGGTHTLEKMRTLADLHLLVLCLEGQSDYADATGTRLLLRRGDLVLVPRGLPHCYRPTPGHTWSEIFVFFRGSLPDLWWSSTFLAPGMNLLRAEPLLHHALRLCQLFRAETGSSDEQLTGLQACLAGLKAGVTGREAATPWFLQARQEFDQGTMRKPDLRELATRLGLSYETFRKSYTARAGMAPGHYRTEAIIRRACNLLNASPLSVKQVAYELDFADEFHFSHTFSRHVGIPPGQYRQLGAGSLGTADTM
jgi:AraC-like DNA-binding protein